MKKYSNFFNFIINLYKNLFVFKLFIYLLNMFTRKWKKYQ